MTGKAKPSLWLRLTKYFREVRSELRKVAWPNRKEVINNTGIVLLVVVIVALFIGVVDFLISNLLGLLSRIGG
ncbi:MAG: preprotein translocase subunit SecE [Firmicutes bacterium]|nr:preprotein translocase subunit SecE [Bacillota bacterium]